VGAEGDNETIEKRERRARDRGEGKRKRGGGKVRGRGFNLLLFRSVCSGAEFYA